MAPKSPPEDAAGSRPFKPAESRYESLGTQFIEGIQTESDRVTLTYFLGSPGNEKPVVTTSEHWLSRELRLNIFAKSFDPRHGETSVQLLNISQDEPDSSLFQVPSDYSIRAQQ